MCCRQMAHVKVDHENTQVQGQAGEEVERQPEPREKEGEDLSVAPEEWQKFHELMAVEASNSMVNGCKSLIVSSRGISNQLF